MKAIIPAKSSSTRVPDKNWRPFHNDLSLTDIKIRQLLYALSPQDIYLSCDDIGKKTIADRYGIEFMLRKEEYASDATPWPDALHGIISGSGLPDDEDIAWVEVINPLFSDYAALFGKWAEVKTMHDSLVLAAPLTKFLIDGRGAPVNFQYGKWHAMSQHMEPLYAWDSACVMRKRDLLYFSYPIGRTPYIYATEEQCVDIDTMADWELAQYLYAKKLERENR